MPAQTCLGLRIPACFVHSRIVAYLHTTQKDGRERAICCEAEVKSWLCWGSVYVEPHYAGCLEFTLAGPLLTVTHVWLSGPAPLPLYLLICRCLDI